MPDCSRIDPLVTPFVDGELPQDEQQTLTQHITACPACRGKVMAERAIRSYYDQAFPAADLVVVSSRAVQRVAGRAIFPLPSSSS